MYKHNSSNMTKEEFFEHLWALYRAMNYADSDDSRRADWMPHQMAAHWGCGHLDKMLHDLVDNKVITQDEFQSFHDNM